MGPLRVERTKGLGNLRRPCSGSPPGRRRVVDSIAGVRTRFDASFDAGQPCRPAPDTDARAPAAGAHGPGRESDKSIDGTSGARLRATGQAAPQPKVPPAQTRHGVAARTGLSVAETPVVGWELAVASGDASGPGGVDEIRATTAEAVSLGLGGVGGVPPCDNGHLWNEYSLDVVDMAHKCSAGPETARKWAPL